MGSLAVDLYHTEECETEGSVAIWTRGIVRTMDEARVLCLPIGDERWRGVYCVVWRHCE